MVMVAGVRFKKACKVYDFDANDLEVKPGETVIVEVDRGLGMGIVAHEPVDKDPAKLQHKLKRVIRKADDVDMERQSFNLERENEAFRICRAKINELKLDMKLIKVEYLFDSSKAIFYFSSEGRIDFRELVKNLASSFHTRIEMRQVGVRDEAKIVGGIGPCGRELCCSNFLSNFAPVTVRMAKEQNLSLNTAKISGLCGRLMCCLSYEHDSYSGGSKGCGKKRGSNGEPCGSDRPEGASDEKRPERASRRGRGERKVPPPSAGRPEREGKREERKEERKALPSGEVRSRLSLEEGDKSASPSSDVVGAKPEEGEKKGRGARRSRRGRGRNRRRGGRGGEGQGSGGGEGRGSGGNSDNSGGGGGNE